MKHFFPLLAVLGMFLFVAGCTGASEHNPFVESPTEKISLNSYAAVESLINQAVAVNAINKQTPILVGTFADINDVNQASSLGRVVAEHFTTRLVQLGYNVSEIKLKDQMELRPDGTFVLTGDSSQVSKTFNAAAIITGTFAKGKTGVLFSSRLIGAANNRLVAAEDFTLPYQGDVKALLKKDNDPNYSSTTPKWYNYTFNND